MNFNLEAIGAVTAVGRNLSMTMASIHTRTQRYDDLEVTDASGQVLSGARTPLEEPELVPRLARLAGLALTDCAARAEAEGGWPVVIQGPDELTEASAQRAFLETLFSSLPPEVRATVRADRLVFVTDQSGGFEKALHEARRLGEASAREATRACYLLSTDCLTAEEKARFLLREGKLLTPGGARGFLPGEGAVALLAGFGSPGRHALGVATAFEREETKPSSGRAVTGALRKAFGLARLPGGPLPAELGFVHDTAFDRGRAEEISYARSRPPLSGVGALRDVSPLLSTGELGVANAALGIATAAFFLEKGVFASAALAVSGDEGGARGAAVVSKTTGQAGGR